MNLMELLQNQLTPEVVGQLSQQNGTTPEQTQSAAQGIFGTLVSALSKNAATEQGASSLLSALDRDHDGSVLNDVMGLLSGSAPAAAAVPSALNGAGILGHILGSQQNSAIEMVGHMAGVDKSAAGAMMLKLAPLLMGVLGQQKQTQGLNAQGLAGLLSGSVQNAQASGNPMMDMAAKFLDKNGDGSMVDDLMSMGKGLLGGFFGGKK